MRCAALIALLAAAPAALAQPREMVLGDEASPTPPADPAAAAATGEEEEEAAPPAPGPVPVPFVPPPSRPKAKKPRQWFALPVLSYLPETGLGGGASAGLHLHVEGAPRPTSFFATAIYTTEKQGLLDLAADSTLPGGTVAGARARALHYPDRFYGLGPSTQSSNMEHFTRRSIELVASVEIPVPGARAVRVGPRVDLRAEEITDRDPGGRLASGSVVGADGSSSAAAGLSATWDTRDSPFWPSHGSLVQAWWVYAPAATSRTGSFDRGVLELRKFLPLGGGHVLGLHAYGERASPDTPFTLLPRLGNTRFLRGIREGRYRDHVVWAVQSELRSPLAWRISGAAFLAAGDVAHELDKVRLDRPKVAGGAGLRFRLTDQGANIRVDLAASKFGVKLQLLVLEACRRRSLPSPPKTSKPVRPRPEPSPPGPGSARSRRRRAAPRTGGGTGAAARPGSGAPRRAAARR
jgi:hypothetical protein